MKIKILIISDTHGYTFNAEEVIKKYKNDIKMVFHLGDHDSDAIYLQELFPDIRFVYVKGNNDINSYTKEKVVIEINGVKILLVHGNKEKVYYGVQKLYYLCLEENTDIAFFGHTHCPYYEIIDGIHFCNPGSISRPRNTDNPTYGILTIVQTNEDSKKNISFEIFEFEIK